MLTLWYETRVLINTSAMLRTIPCIVMCVVLTTPRATLACAACSGRSDDAMALGLNAAVLTLLAVLLTVLGALVGSLTYLIHRAAKHPLALNGMPEGVE